MPHATYVSLHYLYTYVSSICLLHVAPVYAHYMSHILVLTLYVYCTSTEPSPRIDSIALMDSSLGSKHIFGGKLMRFR